MNPPTHEPERDDELENFLRRRSPMHRRLSDFDHAEPSIELDRLVLNRAREAIETPRQPAMFSGSRWAMPVGLAATILIAFTLVLNVEHQPRKTAAERVAASNAQPQAADMAESARAAPGAAATAPLAKKSVATTAPAAPAPPAAEATATTAAPSVASAKGAAHSDAESWLREIARLRAAGQNTAADRELAAFRRAYPSHGGASLAQPPSR